MSNQRIPQVFTLSRHGMEGKMGEYLCAGGMDILSLICFPCGKGPSVISVQVFSAERQKKI